MASDLMTVTRRMEQEFRYEASRQVQPNGNGNSFVGLGKINRRNVSGALARCRFCRPGDWIFLERS
jgi:hypothetical protein